jgi:hypothetical protein
MSVESPRHLSFFVSGVPADSEDGRATLQSRLTLLSGFITIVALVFYVLLHSTSALLVPGYSWRMLVAPQMRDFFGIAATNGVLWFLYRRRALPVGVLAAMDAGGMFLIALFICLPLVGRGLGGEPSQAVFGTSIIVIGRAALVPTPPVWTLIVSAVASLPVLGFIELFHPTEQVGGWPVGITAPLECAVAVALATVVSSVIYGLRRKVREARQLGQYTLEEKLGQGGMGVVYRARHAMLRRPTAVKLLPPDATHAATLARFEREVQLTSILTHANTISIFDYGRTADGTFYYAMEYIDGVDLDRLVRADGPQPPARVVHILRQICGSLAEAHGIGLIHRDIKPANVMLCFRGGVPDVVKVLDFGLVREVDGIADAALTRDDVVLGTPLFLSPEALTSPQTVDARSDLYALGAVGYYLLTGVHIFEGRTAPEVCSQHLHAAPKPPSQRLGRSLPRGLEALVLACLEKDPVQRPASARELDLRLAACEGVGEWTHAAASQWWQEKQPLRKQGATPTGIGVSDLPTVDNVTGAARSLEGVRARQTGPSVVEVADNRQR